MQISYWKKTSKDGNIKKLTRFEDHCWINVINPTHKEIHSLIGDLNLDEDNLFSGMDPHEIPRADFIDDDAYIYIKVPQKNSI